MQFDNEISKDLRPRLERTGDADLLQPFLDYFSGRSFQTGTSLLALWEGECTAAAATRCLAWRGHLSEDRPLYGCSYCSLTDVNEILLHYQDAAYLRNGAEIKVDALYCKFA